MKIWAPYHPELAERFRGVTALHFYEGVDGLPEIAGGRFRSTAPNQIPLAEAPVVAERLGPRLAFLATSTSPELTPRVAELLRVLEQNGCGLTVASAALAARVKEGFPGLELRASCIMSLYMPFRLILQSPLFTEITGPQLWNYDLDRMSDAVPAEHRHRVSYIVNSACRWDGDAERCDSKICRSHYEAVTRFHLEGRAGMETPAGCFALDRTCTPADSVAHFLGLRARGFGAFKLQGRSLEGQPDPRVLAPLEILERDGVLC